MYTTMVICFTHHNSNTLSEKQMEDNYLQIYTLFLNETENQDWLGLILCTMLKLFSCTQYRKD